MQTPVREREILRSITAIFNPSVVTCASLCHCSCGRDVATAQKVAYAPEKSREEASKGQMAVQTEEVAALLARVALKDRVAFAALYSALSPKLFAICLRLLKDRREAEDALQEVFVKIWNNADRYLPDVASPTAWMNAVARNHAIDRLRARRTAAVGLEAADAVPDPTPGPEAAAITRSEGRRIETCLETLEPARAEAVRRAYVEGDSYQELAERFAVPLNTMRSWLRRSLLQLRECLSP
jgi:RNA polymerase sigma-70 factor (ECF subfamily)